MTDTPEKIWAATGLYLYLDDWSEGVWWAEEGDAYPESSSDERVVEYTRTDVAQAMVAAAYEVAAYEIDKASYRGAPKLTEDETQGAMDAILVCTPTDARAALDAMLAKAREDREMFAWAMEAIAKAREDALREALQRIADLKRGHSEDVDEGQEQAYRAIEALIDRTADRKP